MNRLDGDTIGGGGAAVIIIHRNRLLARRVERDTSPLMGAGIGGCESIAAAAESAGWQAALRAGAAEGDGPAVVWNHIAVLVHSDQDETGA